MGPGTERHRVPRAKDNPGGVHSVATLLHAQG